MKDLLIACPLLEHALGEAFKHIEAAERPEVFWLSNAGHEQPQRLHQELQQRLEQAKDEPWREILLLHGRCGGATEGLYCAKPLVLPRCADCLDLLLWPRLKEPGVFYLTPDWLTGPGNFEEQFARLAAKSGAQKAQSCLQQLVGAYRALAFIELYPGETAAHTAQLRRLSALLQLPVKTCSGSITLLTELVRGARDDRFLCVPPGQAVRFT